MPDQHQSVGYVFTERFNNSGFFDGSESGFGYWFVIIPFGFLLTQYTITGFDACAHLSEETKGASTSAAKGIWQSIFYSALGGYILLLAVVFAVPNDDDRQPGQRGRRRRRRRLHLHRVARRRLGRARALHLLGRPAVLRRVLHDVRVPDDVRLQPRPGGPRDGRTGRRSPRTGCPSVR